MSELTEDTEKFEMSSEEEDMMPGLMMNTGVYTIKMALAKPIPQFLPMDGKRVKIYYKGISKVCVNCLRPGHKRFQCENQRLDWLSYVDQFMMDSNLDPEFFGKWVERVSDWRLKQSREHESNMEQLEQKKQLERERAEKRKTDVSEITRVLSEQRSASDQEKSSRQKNQEKKSREQKNPEELTTLGETQNKRGNEDSTTPQQVQTLDEALESMSVEEFVEIKKKRGRPKNEEKAIRDRLGVDYKSASKKKDGMNKPPSN
jgi:hypothetical protein